MPDSQKTWYALAFAWLATQARVGLEWFVKIATLESKNEPRKAFSWSDFYKALAAGFATGSPLWAAIYSLAYILPGLAPLAPYPWLTWVLVVLGAVFQRSITLWNTGPQTPTGP